MSAPQIQYPPTSGGGAPVGGSGTTNTIPRWTGSSTLGDSLLTQSGATITQTGSVNGAVAFNVTNQNTGASAYSAVEIDSAGASWRLKSIRTAGMFAIERNGVVAVQIDNVLNVGIGTTSPSNKLHVEATEAVPSYVKRINTSTTGPALVLDGSGAFSTNYAGVMFRCAGANIGQIMQEAGGNVYFDYNLTGGSGALIFRPGGGEKVRIDSSGNLGIGTASPLGKLNVENGTTFVGSSANTSQTNNLLNGYGYRIGSTLYGNVSIRSTYDNTTNAASLEFYTSPTGTTTTERARIDSSGRWYVGVSSVVVPASGSVWAIINQPGAAGGQEWHNSSASPGGAALVPSQNRATWYVYQNAVGSEAYSQSCVFTPTGIDLTGASATPGLKLPATPGNADTQTLDCYQEGTWSPTLTGFGGTTPTVSAARYTRVGRVVTLQVYLSATGGASFSSTAASTYISLPTGMTAAISSPGSTSNSGIAADGPCVAYNTGNLYLPTFALRTSDTFLNVTYTV